MFSPAHLSSFRRNPIVAGLLALFLLLIPASGSAMEVFRFLDDQCQGDTGMIIAVDHEKVSLLNLAGEMKEIPQKDLTHILVYYSLENPLKWVKMTGPVSALSREVYTRDTTTPSFVGWAVRFMEDQVVFFTTEGGLSLVSIDKIQALKKHQASSSLQRLGNYKKRRFILNQGFPGCKPERSHPDDLRPVRVLGDQIQINKFLQSFQEGFADLRRFQNRTQFYAKPYLFPKETRLGLILNVKGQEAEIQGLKLPFYFQWSSGRPYSHQAVTALGTKESPWLPMLEPVGSIQADFKSHFFNASYVGNTLAMAAGSDFLVENRFLFSDFYSKMTNQPVFLLPQFNYMALSGIDYGPYSVSGGVFYPLYAIHGGGVFREVLSTKPSPVLRLLYYRGKQRYKLIYSRFNEGGSSPDIDQMRLYPSLSLSNGGLSNGAEKWMREQLSDFHLQVDFLRFGVDSEWNEDVNWGLEGLLIVGDYQETYQTRKQSLKSRQSNASAYVTQRFGSYVQVKGQMNLYHRAYEYDFDSQADSHLDQQQTLTGSIEFFF